MNRETGGDDKGEEIRLIRLSDLRDEALIRKAVYDDLSHRYYLTEDWSPEMYEALAWAGFIATAITDDEGRHYLLPEMQHSYALLDWTRHRVPKRLRGLIRRELDRRELTITLTGEMEPVFKGIVHYHGAGNWLVPCYHTLLRSLAGNREGRRLRAIAVELRDAGSLVAGEVGYLTGGIYTSLTGFFDRARYGNYGKIQLIALAALLERSGYAFWNMGHPYMPYKFDLGAVEHPRQAFLARWREALQMDVPFEMAESPVSCRALLAGRIGNCAAS